jgi:hypothetical protein
MRNTLYLATLAIAAAGALDAGAASMVCGGVGNDERREMAAKAGGSSLALEFSLAGRGNYIADVEVTVRPAKGEAFTGRTDGPICYLQLEPGRYTVEASYNGTRKSTTATIPAKAGKPVRVAMSFPAGPGDKDPAPVSPEEKLQASKP